MKTFFNTLLKFTLYWFYKPTKAIHVDSPGVYTKDKNMILSNIDEIHFKCYVVEGLVVNGLGQTVLFSFVLDKPAGYNVFCQRETIHFEEIKKYVLITITFGLEDDNH